MCNWSLLVWRGLYFLLLYYFWQLLGWRGRYCWLLPLFQVYTLIGKNTTVSHIIICMDGSLPIICKIHMLSVYREWSRRKLVLVLWLQEAWLWRYLLLWRQLSSWRHNVPPMFAFSAIQCTCLWRSQQVVCVDSGWSMHIVSQDCSELFLYSCLIRYETR